MKRLCFLSGSAPSAWSGGSEVLWAELARRCLAQGIQVSIGVKGRSSPPKPVLELGRLGGSVNWTDAPLAFAQRLRRRITGWAPDPFAWLGHNRPTLAIVSQSVFYEALPELLACRRHHIPYVVVVHAASDSYWPEDDILDQARECYLGAEECWFVSEASRRLVERQLGLSLGNAAIIRNPFKVSYSTSLPWPSSDKYRLACVGRLAAWPKGQDLLIDLFSQSKWKQRQIEISLFGQGPHERLFRRMIENNGITSIFLCGHTGNLEEVWLSHHALVLPSRTESMPLTVIEAMLCARPCIATDVGGIREVIRDGETGFVAPTPHLSDLDDALERAWQDRHNWEAIGHKAAASIRQIVPADPVADLISHIARI